MRQGIILLFILFVIFGCGYQSTPSEDNKYSTPNTSQPTSKILPEKISVNFPTALKDTISSTSNSSDNKLEEKKEINLNQLQKDIYRVEDVVQISEFNIILLEQVMPEILKSCDGIESCIFEDGELSFLLDKKIISEIDKALDKKERDFLNKEGTLVSLGQIEFSKYENQKYEYELKFNMLNSSFIKEDSSIKKQIQILKWSNTTDKVTITYLYNNDINTINTTIRYFINKEGEELMYISDKNDTNVSIENRTIVVKNSDNNSTYSLTSNTTIQQLSENETNTSHFSTNIEVDDSSSHLLLLDKNTTLDLNHIPNINDNLNVVVVPTKPIVVTGPGHDTDTNRIPSTVSEVDNSSTLFVFEVDGDGLASGDYILLKPDTDTTTLNLEEILNASIGSFSVTEGKPQGALYSNEFLDILSELIIVKIIDSQESTEVSEFIVIENKPKLNIVKK